MHETTFEVDRSFTLMDGFFCLLLDKAFCFFFYFDEKMLDTVVTVKLSTKLKFNASLTWF